MKAIIGIVASGLIWAASIGAAAQSPPHTLTSADLRQDLAFFKDRLIALHPNPFGRIARAEFETRFSALEQRLPQLTRDQFLVELMQLVASLGDGHTSLSPLAQSGLHILPLRFQQLDGALYLTGSDEAYRKGLGGRVLTINSMPAAEIVKRVRSVTSGDNESSIDARIPQTVIVPEVLVGLGIASDPEQPVRFELQHGSGKAAISVRPSKLVPSHPAPSFLTRYSDNWIDLSLAPRPAWLANAQKAYWYEYRPDSKTIFVQYNRADNDHADPMPAFARRLRGEIASRNPDRVVLDLRHNLGGESFWNRPLLLALLRSDSLEPRGKLFVLTGGDTFSAGTLLAIELEKYSNAIFVGEPTGGGLQNFGNHEPVTLPNTKVTLMVATKYYQNNGPNDDRKWVAPQLAVPVTADDLKLGRDPAMAAVLSYQPTDQLVRSAVLAAPPASAVAAALRILRAPIYRYLHTEPILTGVGYQFLRDGDHARAVQVMRLAVEQNPHQANAHDSLGDAYRAAGDREAAIASYRKALELSAGGWESARRSLQELGVMPASPPGH